MQYSKVLFQLCTVLLLQGCSALFFYPDHTTYRTPEFYNLNYDDVYFKAKDQTSLHAWYIYPEHEAKGLVFVAHGNAQNLSSHFASWVWLVEKGYALFIFDYRGYGKSDGKADIAGAIEDTKAALDYLEGIYGGDYIACGQSLGGSLLLNAMEGRDNTHIKALVIDSTFTGFADIVNEKLDKNWLTWPFQWLPYLTLPSAYDASKRFSRLDKPVLFLHGSFDSVISANNSWQLFEIASVPKEFWLVKKADHIQAMENEKLRRDFLDFLEKGNDYFNPDYSRMKIYE